MELGDNWIRKWLTVAGEMVLDVPPYLQVTHNEETKKVSLNVQDVNEVHQRAMWGRSTFSTT